MTIARKRGRSRHEGRRSRASMNQLLQALESRLLLTNVGSGALLNLHVSVSDAQIYQQVSLLTPQSIRHQYGLDAISFGGIVGDGTGQTIAVVDAYDDPQIMDDLNGFNTAFGLPAVNVPGGPSFN